MKTQIGKLVTADFEDRTLTFEMSEDAVVKFGEYAIVPIDEYKKMRHVQPVSLGLNGLLKERNMMKRVVTKWLMNKQIVTLTDSDVNEIVSIILKAKS